MVRENVLRGLRCLSSCVSMMKQVDFGADRHLPITGRVTVTLLYEISDHVRAVGKLDRGSCEEPPYLTRGLRAPTVGGEGCHAKSCSHRG